jgi:predicted ATP-grasp superfamily ATP-dependent carboligase
MRHLLIAGASVRAAAASALRAGWTPWCVDVFADTDLARACPARATPLDHYPHALIDQLALGPPGPWMYGGGLENDPHLLMIPDRELWGNSAGVVAAVRDPFRLAAVLAEFDMPPMTPPFGGRVLIKPRRGSGGGDIRHWAPGASVPKESYLQELVAGVPASAVFVGYHGQSMLLGATRQLIGCSWLHAARPFQYAGSIGPLACSGERLAVLGQRLVDEFGLRGLFGVDFLLDGDRIRPLEVNPRYPASLEILERVFEQPLLRHHARAFTGEGSSLVAPSHASQFHGKAVLFARVDIEFPKDGPWTAAFDFALDSLQVPFADVPAPGQHILRGAPILTFFSNAASMAECESALVKIAADLDRALGKR